MRYGETPRSASQFPHLQFNWEDLSPPEKPQPQQSPKQPPSRDSDPDEFSDSAPLVDFVQLYERTRDEPLPDLYAELKSLPQKTPFDYYALAVISDLLVEEEFSFPYWLLKGLQVHHEEPALFILLHQYFVSVQTIEGLDQLLVQTARVVRTDRFYYLTENAWDRLLREAPFETFRRVLETCEMHLLDHEVDHLLVFYVHLLKAAIWKADPNWLRTTFAQLEEHVDRMPFWLELEFEFLFVLKSYQENRADFLTGGPVRKLIDQSIIDYCTQSEQVADRSFLECQHALVSQRDELMREFKLPAVGCETAVIVWETIAADVFQRMDEKLVPTDPAVLSERTRQLARRLFDEGNGAEYKKAVQIPWLSFALFFLISVMVAMTVLIYKSDTISGTLLVIGSLLLINGVAFIACLVVADVVAQEFYESWWRRQLMTFYQSYWYPLPQLAAELKRLNGSYDGTQQFRGLNEVASRIRTDAGLWFYSTAQRLLSSCR